MHRIALLCDSNRPITAHLMNAIVAETAARPDVEVTALVTRNRLREWDHSSRQRVRSLARAALVAATNRDVGFEPPTRFRVPGHVTVIGPNDAATNSGELIKRLRDDLGVDVLISLYYGGILSAEFLSAFPHALNFHPALLPRHRGLAPTAFARYEGDRAGGFSFHRMTPGIDEGPVLYQESLPLGVAAGRYRKQLTGLSVAAVPAVLDRLLAGEVGEEQHGEASYHNRSELQAVRVVEQPESLTRAELFRRLRAFETLYLTIGGEQWPVTGLRPAGRRPATLSFTTLDGVVLAAHRLAHLPTGLVRLRRRLRRH